MIFAFGEPRHNSMGFIAPWMNYAITLYTLYPSTFGKHAARTLALGMESAKGGAHRGG